MKIEIGKKYKSPLLNTPFSVISIKADKVHIRAWAGDKIWLDSWVKISTFKRIYKTIGE